MDVGAQQDLENPVSNFLKLNFDSLEHLWFLAGNDFLSSGCCMDLIRGGNARLL